MASTGHIGNRVTSWKLVNREGAGAAEYEIVFPPITDAYPTSRTEYDLFHVALNYFAEDGGPELCAFEQIQVFRPDGLTGKIRVPANDVYRLESKLEDLAPSQLCTESKLDLAIEEMLERLEGRGYEKQMLFNLEKLNAAAKRLACSYCCFDLVSLGRSGRIRRGFGGPGRKSCSASRRSDSTQWGRTRRGRTSGWRPAR